MSEFKFETFGNADIHAAKIVDFNEMKSEPYFGPIGDRKLHFFSHP
jgi:hypothetical protein